MTDIAYEPPESLWGLIKQNVKECELDLMKSTIGESLIDTSIELHQEVETLLDIWRDYRDETVYSLNQIIVSNSSSKTFLPEPPDQRERLIKEINFFLKQMREKCDSKTFCNQLTAQKHNLNVINYVLNTASTKFDDNESMTMFSSNGSSRLTPKSIQRPSTSMSKNGTMTPCMKTFRSENNCSKMSSTLEIVEDKLNVNQIDEIVEHLREVLQEEVDTLLKDIDFLYECIDKESEYRLQSKQNLIEPTLTELKEERKRLEENILDDQRPSSNNSISSISLSVKSPSPGPQFTRRVIESPTSTRTKLPLTLSSLNKTGVNTTNDLKLRAKKPTEITNREEKPLNTNKVMPRKIEHPISSNTASNHTYTLKTRTPLPVAKVTNNKNNGSFENLTSISPTPSSAPSSASSRTSSVSSLIRSKILVPNASKQNAAERFRKMVLDSRDTS
jgi:hypothetical protein